MSIDPNDLLLGSGVPSAKFRKHGDICRGIVEYCEVTQQTDIDRKPLTWDDGRPRLQVVITLATDERDPEITNDDGRRRLFVKAQMQKAVSDALRAAGAGVKLEVGGILAVQYVSDAAPSRPGVDGAKQYRAQYVSPTISETNDLLGAAAPTSSNTETPADVVATADLL